MAVPLGVYYHLRLLVGEAASLSQSMPVGTLDFLEEPIRDEMPESSTYVFLISRMFDVHQCRGRRGISARACRSLKEGLEGGFCSCVRLLRLGYDANVG